MLSFVSVCLNSCVLEANVQCVIFCVSMYVLGYIYDLVVLVICVRGGMVLGGSGVGG